MDNNIDQIQNSLGAGNKSEIVSAATMALPAMLEALNKNTKTKEGAQSLSDALDKDHDGTKLNDVASMISNYKNEDGQGILNHLFGSNKDNVVNAVSGGSGLDKSSTLDLMSMLAPFLLEYLGKNKKEQNLDAQGVSDLTSMFSVMLKSSNKDLMGTITGLLDGNKDGNIVDDAINLLGNLFKK